MALSEQFSDQGDIHPIDLVEHIAEHNDWEFDRIADDQIAMAVEGRWRTYSVTLAWSAYDETLRLICTFEMEPPAERLPALYEMLNQVNDQCWAGSFTWWAEQKMMVFRYGLVLSGDSCASPEQIDTMISAAVLGCERYYPAFQLVTWGERAAEGRGADRDRRGLRHRLSGANQAGRGGDGRWTRSDVAVWCCSAAARWARRCCAAGCGRAAADAVDVIEPNPSDWLRGDRRAAGPTCRRIRRWRWSRSSRR